LKHISKTPWKSDTKVTGKKVIAHSTIAAAKEVDDKFVVEGYSAGHEYHQL